jgi:hypothetical protein
MTAVAERPIPSEASPEEWLVEQNTAFALKHSTDFIDSLRKTDSARFQRDRREVQLAREKREAEDREQEADRERIRQQNEAEAAAVLAQTCQSCFCIHAGEC